MSAYTIKGAEGVVINSTYFLELPKAPTKQTTYAERAGMIRYNSEWKAFEGVIEFTDGSLNYRRFAQLDENGQLQTSQLPDSITSGMQWIGTYAPISDDIDPPVDSAYTKLPSPIAANSGQYYIVRGIYDAAVTHFRANNPTTATVTFTPTNPSSAGNWIQIKYYIDTDPTNTANKIVVAAFARIVTVSIPATGHEGLVSLANNDSNLTAAFTSVVDKTAELGLTDGDWIISTGSTNVRLRQNRVSVSAAAVSFDRTFMTSSNRSFTNSSGTVQTIIDSLLLQGLRRTGDTMYNDGSTGAGRLGVVYGTATAPSIAFNSNTFNATTDPGINPALWSDTTTGIFHPATGSIGLSASGTERLRVSPTQLILYPVTTSTAAVPNILFSATGNTVLGMNVKSNTIDFVSNSAVNVSLAQGLSTFNGNIIVTGNNTVNGNNILGDSSTDTLTVNATSTFNAPTLMNNTLIVKGNTTFNADTIIGDNSTDTLIVNATSTFNSPATFNNNLNINGNLNVTGNTVLGDSSTDTLIVNATSTFNAPINSTSTITATGNITSNQWLYAKNGYGDIIGVGGDATGSDYEIRLFNNTRPLTIYSPNGNVSFNIAGSLNVLRTSVFNENTTFNGNTNTFVKDITLPISSKINFGLSNLSVENNNLIYNMNGYDDITIMDGSVTRTQFNRYGIKLPFIDPVDDSVGVDGMIAYDSANNGVIQKASGKWIPVGTGAGSEITFSNTEWILNGAYYTYTITMNNIQNISVQELIGSNYSPVDVDSVIISTSNAVLSIPSTPDLRFNGRVIVQSQ